MRSLPFSVMVLLLFAGCSSTGSYKLSRSSEYNIITRAEIEKAMKQRPMQNVYEAIEFMRPRYLTPRVQNTVSQGALRSDPIVYVNGTRLGTIEELRNIDLAQVGEIQYLKSYEATQRYGMGHEGGAILVNSH